MSFQGKSIATVLIALSALVSLGIVLSGKQTFLSQNATQSNTGDRRPVFSPNFQGRIAYSADGNDHDRDDIGATPLGLAILGKAGLQEKLVHYDYNSHIWESSEQVSEMTESAITGADLFGFDSNVFIDAAEAPDLAHESIANAINQSTADDPLFLVVAGPMDVACKGILKSDKSKRKYVVVISHSWWNNEHKHGENDCVASKDRDAIALAAEKIDDNTRDIRKTGVWFDQIPDQNEGLNIDSYDRYAWLKDSNDSNLRWVYDRMQLAFRGKADPSDAGMLFYLLTEDENATPEKLEAFFNTQGSSLLPALSSSLASSSSRNINTDLLNENLSPIPTAAVWLDGQRVYSKGNIRKSIPAYSISKSLTALVFARLKQLDKIDYDTVVPNSEGASYAQFMSMSSNYRLEGVPGESHAYNNNAVHYYGDYMRRTYFGDRSEVDTIKLAFMDKLGSQDPITYEGLWSGWGKGFSMSARDYGKVGQLILNRGVYDGEQIISADFVEQLYDPKVSGEPNYDQGPNDRLNQHHATRRLQGSYSYGWWIVPGESRAIAATGFRGKRLIVSPEKKLVIVGLEDREDPWKPEQYLEAVLPAIE